MRVSVVIPAYNEEKYIGACLDSLMKQDEMPNEIIVVNNNSTDDTVKIAKKYPVKIVNEKKQGMINSRNRGFNTAQFELIAQTDADTILPRNWIKKIKRDFQKDKMLIALSGPADFYDVPEDVPASKWATNKVFKSYIKIMKKILMHDVLFGPNKILKKSAWEKVRKEVCMNDEDVHEDIDLSIHLGPYGKIKFNENLIVRPSFRRWKRLGPLFEYPYRAAKSVRKHKQLVVRARATKLVKKLMSKVISVPF